MPYAPHSTTRWLLIFCVLFIIGVENLGGAANNMKNRKIVAAFLKNSVAKNR